MAGSLTRQQDAERAITLQKISKAFMSSNCLKSSLRRYMRAERSLVPEALGINHNITWACMS